MKLSTFSRLAPVFYSSGKSIYLRGGPGRGKTDTIRQAVPDIAAAKGLNLGLVLITGPLLTPSDTVGYLVPSRKETTDDEGEVHVRVESLYTDPFWWRTSEGKRLEEYDGGVIFIDEADKVDVDVKKILGEMALSGRCGPHQLPKGWVVWMAGNRQGDRSGSTKELDHLINRRYEIDMTDDLEGWERWAVKHGVHPSIIAFAANNPVIVFPEGAPDKQGPFCTPRSLVSVGEMLQQMAGGSTALPTDTDAVEVAAAGIGAAAAAQLFATIRLEDELPPIADIIAKPGTTRIPSAPDAQMLVCYKLAMIAEKKTIKPFCEYIERLPTDFGATFIRALIGRDNSHMSDPTILAWCGKNSALVMLMSMLSK